MRQSKFLAISFFLVLIVTSFDIIFEENIPLPQFYSLIKLCDEAYIAILFLFTIVFHNKYNRIVLVFTGILFLVGLFGNIASNSSLAAIFLGFFSTMKPVLLFWCFCQYDFSWQDFHLFKKLVCLLFPFVVISYLLDIAFSSFRSDIGIVSQAVEIRMGVRSLGGFFNRFTVATMYALLFFVIFRFYSKKVVKWKILFVDFMFLSSLKMKDILGFLLARSFHIFKKFKAKYIVWVSVGVYALFLLYASLLPEHYNEYFNTGEDGNVARVVLGFTSLRIMMDRFPLGVGWGMFGSPTSQQLDSPVYSNYGIDNVYGLSSDFNNFMADTFWPMIFGETGVMGTILYCIILYKCFYPFLKRFFKDTHDLRFLMPSFLFIAYVGFSIGKPVFSGPPHSLVLWGIAGMFYSLSKKDYEFERKTKKYSITR